MKLLQTPLQQSPKPKYAKVPIEEAVPALTPTQRTAKPNHQKPNHRARKLQPKPNHRNPKPAPNKAKAKQRVGRVREAKQHAVQRQRQRRKRKRQ